MQVLPLVSSLLVGLPGEVGVLIDLAPEPAAEEIRPVHRGIVLDAEQVIEHAAGRAGPCRAGPTGRAGSRR